MPTVTIGLPVFNGERYLASAIESILAQTFTDFELLLSDNASTDATPDICADFAARDDRVQFERNDANVGAAANFNRVFRRAHGRYFKWAAHDDLLEREYLARTVEALRANPDAVAAHSSVEFIDGDGRRLHADPFPLHRVGSPRPSERFADLVLTPHWSFWSFALMRTEMLNRTDLIGSYTSSDRVLLAQLALLGRFVQVPEVAFLSRDHPERALKRVPNRLRLPRIFRAIGPLPAAEWYDPAHSERIVFPQWYLWSRYWDVVRRAALDPAEHAGCRRALLQWLLRNRNAIKLVRDLALAAEHWFLRASIRLAAAPPAGSAEKRRAS
jgi:glycosyltransferase involved in cell wall biosynthesis